MTTPERDWSTDDLVRRFTDVRARTERLAAPLSPEDQTVQTMPDVSPAKWHRAHTTWFFETFVLREYADGYEPVEADFDYLFNSYYEAVGERHPRADRGFITRPGAAEIGAYRRAVDHGMCELLTTATESEVAELAPLVWLGTHHEEQHQELMLMDLKHVLSMNVTEPVYVDRPHAPTLDPGAVRWIEHDGGTVSIGHPGDADGFAFDNESPRHDVLLQPFCLADRLVTAGEWIEFIDDDGYQRPELWLSDGWYTRLDQGWQAPLYWRGDRDRGWRVHTLTGTRAVDVHEPVCHVSFYEADAYATWAGARLPTEGEWEVAAADHPVTGNLLFADPTEGPLHPVASGDGTGVRQLYGDCWEWTGTPYRPYPGYHTPDGAIGEYNGKFMINTMVLRGGCAFTPPDHVRSTYRNFFHPHTRWHLSGVRLATDR